MTVITINYALVYDGHVYHSDTLHLIKTPIGAKFPVNINLPQDLVSQKMLDVRKPMFWRFKPAKRLDYRGLLTEIEREKWPSLERLSEIRDICEERRMHIAVELPRKYGSLR